MEEAHRGVGGDDSGYTMVAGNGREKKNYDDSSSDSFSFLATLKKPMDVISEYHVVLVNPHTFFRLFLSFRDYFRSHSLACLPFRHDSGMPPQSQKKKCHTTDSSLMIYTYAYIYIYTYLYTLANALDQKYFACSFPFLCQSRRGTPGERDENWGNVRERERERVCILEKEKS